MAVVTVWLTIHRLPDDTYFTDVMIHHDDSPANTILARDIPITLDFIALRELVNDPDAYGRLLSQQYFADPRLRKAWVLARSYAAFETLQLRLNLPSEAANLHNIAWETLRDPEADVPLALQERIRFVRYAVTPDLNPIVIPPRPNLRALIIVANPSDLAQYGLAPIDVYSEVDRARAALGDIPITILGDHTDALGRATSNRIIAQLRDGTSIVLLFARSRNVDDATYLWLERDDGTTDVVSNTLFVRAVSALAIRPLLIILLNYQSAGSPHDSPLNDLGPRLVSSGVGAVLSFQRTEYSLLQMLFNELRRDGQIDRAFSAARAASGANSSWWQPVLWLRTDGRLWVDQLEAPSNRDIQLRALLHNHRSFVASKMDAFIGRESEVVEIRHLIAKALPTGGYITITGQAGQGKSSVIAKLVDGEIAEHGDTAVIYHFIPYSPGPDHQVGLLRNLIARLCLTYNLPEIYASSDSRPALRDYFASALREIAARDKRVTIYIDGLDQLEVDANGVRDLSFLPVQLPQGIVIVLGTRPDDTLKILELRKPQHEYWLPPLSRADFDLVLTYRGARLEPSIADQIYAAMQENTLYLDLAAREVAIEGITSLEAVIPRVSNNPDNLFAIAISRLQSNKQEWENVLRPVLGLLLVARAPISRSALRTLTGIDDLRIRQGLNRIGGLIYYSGDGQVGLFHYKLKEYLIEKKTDPGKEYVFSDEEATDFDLRFADWAEEGNGSIATIWQDVPSDALEQERRIYARQHYLAHLQISSERISNVDISATVLGRLAKAYFYLRDYDNAIVVAKQALVIQERRLGPTHLDVGAVLKVLGLAYQDRGDLQMALPLLERSAAIYQALSGLAESTKALNDLAMVLWEMQDLQAVERLDELSTLLSSSVQEMDPNADDVQNTIEGVIANLGAGLVSASEQAQSAAVNRITSHLDALSAEIERSIALQKILEPILERWRIVVSRVAGQIGRLPTLTFMTSPYVFTVPVQGNQLVGRDDIFRRIEALWSRPGQRNSLLIHGHRRMGKTSVAQALQSRCNFGDDTRLCYLTMEGVDLSQEGFLLFEIAYQLYQLCEGRIKEPDEKQFHSVSPRTSFNRYIHRIDKVIAPLRIIVVLDEFERIDRQLGRKRFIEIIDFLRAKTQTYHWLALALVGLTDLDDLSRSYQVTVLGWQGVRISFLSPEQVRQVLVRPPNAPDVFLDYKKEAVQLIADLTNGQPYLVQVIGDRLVELFNQRLQAGQRNLTTQIDHTDVEMIISDKDFYDYANAYFSGVWSQFESGHSLLVAVAAQDEGIDEQKLRSTLESQIVNFDEPLSNLLRHEILLREDRVIRFRVPLMHTWVLKMANQHQPGVG
mgnify:CR=1 FL=1